MHKDIKTQPFNKLVLEGLLVTCLQSWQYISSLKKNKTLLKSNISTIYTLTIRNESILTSLIIRYAYNNSQLQYVI